MTELLTRQEQFLRDKAHKAGKGAQEAFLASLERFELEKPEGDRDNGILKAIALARTPVTDEEMRARRDELRIVGTISRMPL